MNKSIDNYVYKSTGMYE